MLCKIADLITEVPEAGDLVSRCKDYLYNCMDSADISIRTELFRKDYWPTNSEDMSIYLESGTHFYSGLLQYNGLMLHASAVEMGGKAYLFSGNSGAGKSTHTRIWQQVFAENAQVFNDDKPALRRIDGKWYAYGTPWCGKDGINQNKKVPLAGICFLKQSTENRIRRLSLQETIQRIIVQTPWKYKTAEKLDLLLASLNYLVREIPVFELENRPEPEAAQLSYETMRRAAEEFGL